MIFVAARAYFRTTTFAIFYLPRSCWRAQKRGILSFSSRKFPSNIPFANVVLIRAKISKSVEIHCGMWVLANNDNKNAFDVIRFM